MNTLRRSVKSRLRAGALAGVLRLGLGSAVGLGALGGLAGCHLRATGPALASTATPAPFTLASTQGRLDSAVAVEKGPLVLIFYRGHW